MAQPPPHKRVRRTTLLLEREPLHVEYAMAHPRQRAMVAILAERIEALRKARTDEAVIALQEDLIDRMMAAQGEQDAAKAQRVRVGRQPHADPNEVHAAEIELVVADRIVRQLRAIGDAIAWRAARFHRKVFAVCAHEPGGGPVFGKAGWAAEVERAREIWERDGELAIVNGITNCLRAADVTVFGKAGVRLEEVKSKAGSRRAGQRARWRELEAAINTGTPYTTNDGRMQVWECDAQLRTRVKADLEPALREADRIGTSTRRLGQGWILIVTTREGYRQNRGRLTVDEIRQRRLDAIAHAGMANVAHHLNLNTVDATSRAAWAAPFSVFPLPPTDCALLICDYAVYESRMSYDRFEDALRRKGLSVQHYLTAENKTESANSVFATLRSKTRALHLRTSAITQMLLELVEPTVYASAYVEAINHQIEPGASGIFVFANERAAWR